VAAGAAYALGAAATSPFSWPGDAVTALPVVVLAVLVVVRWPRRPQPQALPLEAGRAVRGGHPFRAWFALLAVALAWELAEYFARGSRGAHPTLSSMADALDRTYVLKALVFFGWLCLGVCIVRRGAREAPGEAP
jgi:membrane protein implicated in regulation of membrane protease activity